MIRTALLVALALSACAQVPTVTDADRARNRSNWEAACRLTPQSFPEMPYADCVDWAVARFPARPRPPQPAAWALNLADNIETRMIWCGTSLCFPPEPIYWRNRR